MVSYPGTDQTCLASAQCLSQLPPNHTLGLVSVFKYPLSSTKAIMKVTEITYQGRKVWEQQTIVADFVWRVLEEIGGKNKGSQDVLSLAHPSSQLAETSLPKQWGDRSFSAQILKDTFISSHWLQSIFFSLFGKASKGENNYGLWRRFEDRRG